MITLEIEKYCHDCEDFTPEIQTIYADKKLIQTKIYCLLGARCRKLKNRQTNNEKAEFACRVCFEKLKRDNPQAKECAWRGLDNEYCPELKKILEREATE